MTINGVTIPTIKGEIVGLDAELSRLTFKVKENITIDAVLQESRLIFEKDFTNLLQVIADMGTEIRSLKNQIAEAKK